MVLNENTKMNKKVWIYALLAVLASLLILIVCNTIQTRKALKQQINTKIELVDSLQKANDNLSETVVHLTEKSDRMTYSIDSLKKVKNKIIYSHSETVNHQIDTVTLLEVDEEIISRYEDLVQVKDSIITKQQHVISNYKISQSILEMEIANKDGIIKDYNDKLVKERNKKIFWQATTAVAAGAAITLLIL